MTKRITISISDETHRLIEQAARVQGVKVSPWLDKAVRREAVRQGVASTPVPLADVLAEAFADEADFEAAERDQDRRAG